MIEKVNVEYIGEDNYGEHSFDLQAGDRKERIWCHTEEQYTTKLLAFMCRALQPANSPFLKYKGEVPTDEHIPSSRARRVDRGHKSPGPSDDRDPNAGRDRR